MRIDPIYALIGRRIREEREALNATQGALSAMTGMARTSIANIEAGRQRVQLDDLIAIAQALGSSVEELMRERQAEELPLFVDV